MAGLGWEEDEVIQDDTSTPQGESPSLTAEQRNKRMQGVRFRRAVNQEANEVLEEAILIYKQKNSLKKAIQHLVKKNFMSDTGNYYYYHYYYYYYYLSSLLLF